MAAPPYATFQWEHDQFVAQHPYPHTAHPSRSASRKVVNHALTGRRCPPKVVNDALTTYRESGIPDPEGREKMIMNDQSTLNEATGERSAADPLGIATADPRPRCRFGRPHTWALGLYLPDGTWAAEYVKCWECGQVEWDGPDDTDTAEDSSTGRTELGA